MLKYLIVQLDDASVSFCHYSNNRSSRKLMPLDTLRNSILWAMKENLMLQFLYPDYPLPEEYADAISGTYHADIVSSMCEDKRLREAADVVVFDSWAVIQYYPFASDGVYAIRTSFNDLLSQSGMLYMMLTRVHRINVVFTDVPTFGKNNDDEVRYKAFLSVLSSKLAEEYSRGHNVQINLLTDRILLTSMNNCNAGCDSIAICPDGNFYVCPAFYSDSHSEYAIGSPVHGLDIKNPQLYKLNYAPICRQCDAWHCRRCVWLNKTQTLEVNTPGRAQCVMAHIERNESRNLLAMLRLMNIPMPTNDIPEINYTDPFEKLIYR